MQFARVAFINVFAKCADHLKIKSIVLQKTLAHFVNVQFAMHMITGICTCCELLQFLGPKFSPA